jgi:hypothetical protein
MDAEPQVDPPVAREILPTARGTVLTGASLIDIGAGETAPLGELLAARHKRCPHCSEGWVIRKLPSGDRSSAVCGCCVQGWRASRARQARPANDTANVEVASLRDLERAAARVDRLGGNLAGLEAERAERVRVFEGDNADLLGAVRSAAATEQDESTLVLRAGVEVDHLRGGVADAERKLELMRAALGGAEAKLRAHQEARALAQAMGGDAEREIERRRAGLNLERLDREIAKLRRRLTGARIYGGLADGPPAVEGA